MHPWHWCFLIVGFNVCGHVLQGKDILRFLKNILLTHNKEFQPTFLSLSVTWGWIITLCWLRCVLRVRGKSITNCKIQIIPFAILRNYTAQRLRIYKFLFVLFPSSQFKAWKTFQNCETKNITHFKKNFFSVSELLSAVKALCFFFFTETWICLFNKWSPFSWGATVQ
jgi:hypothetical protein